MLLPIPGTLNYSADDLGNVYDGNGKKLKTYRNGDGYVTALVVDFEGVYYTTGVHRLVALAFKSKDRTIEKNQVNHLDGDIENNTPPNLDWDTAENNNIHAGLMRKPGKERQLVLCNTEMKPIFFSNLWEVSEYLEISVAEAWFMFRDKTPDSNGSLLIKNVGLGTDFHLTKIKNRDSLGRQPERHLKMMNLVTGETYTGYASELARHFLTTASHITTSVIKDGVLRLFRSNWLIVDIDSEFPELDAEVIDLLRTRGKGKPVVVLNRQTKEFLTYPSAAKFVADQNLSKKSVTTQLANREYGSSVEFLFCYDTDDAKERLKSLAVN